MLLERLWFIFIVLPSVIGAWVGKNKNTRPRPVAQSFENKEELMKSTFWQKVLQGNGKYGGADAVAYLRELNSSLYFLESAKPDPLTSQGIRTKFSRKSKHDHVLGLIEVQFGEGHDMCLDDVPVSPCISSRFSTGGASFQQSYGKTLGLDITIAPEVSALVAALGITLSGTYDALSLSYGVTGGITCNIPVGGVAQVFGLINYKVFPHARKRFLTFYEARDQFDESEWESIELDNPNFKKFGAVFFDKNTALHHQCVTDIEDLECDLYEHIWKSRGDREELDGLGGLALAQEVHA